MGQLQNGSAANISAHRNLFPRWSNLQNCSFEGTKKILHTSRIEFAFIVVKVTRLTEASAAGGAAKEDSHHGEGADGVGYEIGEVGRTAQVHCALRYLYGTTQRYSNHCAKGCLPYGERTVSCHAPVGPKH
jgi:hypothetical protein